MFLSFDAGTATAAGGFGCLWNLAMTFRHFGSFSTDTDCISVLMPLSEFNKDFGRLRELALDGSLLLVS